MIQGSSISFWVFSCVFSVVFFRFKDNRYYFLGIDYTADSIDLHGIFLVQGSALYVEDKVGIIIVVAPLIP